MTTTTTPVVKLQATAGEPGRRTWTVTIDGRYAGLLGDTRPWRGSHSGGLRWWAALRDTEDPRVAALWNTGDQDRATRRAALDELLAEHHRRKQVAASAAV